MRTSNKMIVDQYSPKSNRPKRQEKFLLLLWLLFVGNLCWYYADPPLKSKASLTKQAILDKKKDQETIIVLDTSIIQATLNDLLAENTSKIVRISPRFSKSVNQNETILNIEHQSNEKGESVENYLGKKWFKKIKKDKTKITNSLMDQTNQS